MTSKFELGEATFPIFIEEGNTKVVCPQCDGEKVVSALGREKKCLWCNGEGTKIEYRIIFWKVGARDRVISITFEFDGEIYSTKNGCFKPENLFSTQTEAQKECDRRNYGKF